LIGTKCKPDVWYRPNVCWRSAWVQHLRVKIDVLKWTASKLKPRTWGDRLDVSVTHEQISIIQVLEEASKRVDSIANPKPKEVIDVDSKVV